MSHVHFFKEIIYIKFCAFMTGEFYTAANLLYIFFSQPGIVGGL